MNDAIELSEGIHGRAEGLLVDHPRPFGQTMGTDRFGQRTEGRGRDGHVVDQLWLTAQFLLRFLHDMEKAPGVGALEPTPGKSQPGAHLVPRPFRGLGPELLQAFAHLFLKVLMGKVTPSVPHQTPLFGQEPGDGQTVEGREDEAVSQVPGASEQDEDGGLGDEPGVGHRELLGCVSRGAVGSL